MLSWLLFLSVAIPYWCTFAEDIFDYKTVKSCSINEIFNPVSYSCQKCEDNTEKNRNGLECVCKPGFHQIRVNRTLTEVLKCQKCPNNKVVSKDGYSCISCPENAPFDPQTQTCGKCHGGVFMERSRNGTMLNESQCLTCDPSSFPEGKVCGPCPHGYILITGKNGNRCTCPKFSHSVVGDICLKKTDLESFPDVDVAYEIRYDSGIYVDSEYFRKNVRASTVLCESGRNRSACQLLANLCVLMHYDADKLFTACSKLRELIDDYSPNVPPIYIKTRENDAVLNQKSIPIQYTFRVDSERSLLNLSLAKYSHDGVFQGFEPAVYGALQLCPETQPKVPFLFGIRYFRSCKLSAKQLWEMKTTFYELFLYYKGRKDEIIRIPVKNLNIQKNNVFVNKGVRSSWQLSRRFFLVDTLSGREGDSDVPRVVRYASRVHLSIRLRRGDGAGKIYPPVLTVEYNELENKQEEATCVFSVSYETAGDKLVENMSIAVSVIGVLVLIRAIIETWSWSRRNEWLSIDITVLGKYALFSMGGLSDALLLVTASTCVYYFLIWRGQGVAQLMLPGLKQEEVVRGFFIAAFVFKLVEVIHVIACQVTVDIFLLDWERPKPTGLSKDVHKGGSDSGASIWRTYLIANEFNELQSFRKINPTLKIMSVLFLLKVCKFETWTTFEPNRGVELDISADYSIVCRVGLVALVFIGVSVAQLAFSSIIYERYIENKMELFEALCSLGNISMFILSERNFGYYIHGRSAHGNADIDLYHIQQNLEREEADLSGHRGLLPSTDLQSFTLSVPSRLRQHLDRIMLPAQQRTQGIQQTRGQGREDSTKKSASAYNTMNKFLSSFIDHALRDLGYDVRERLLMETLLDMELQTADGKALFYHDNAHSWSSLLWYGKEWTLWTLELLTFLLVDIYTYDFLLAGIVTYFIVLVCRIIRSNGGKRNLSQKALIDERFLI